VAAATLHDDFQHDGDTILVIGMLSPRDPHAILEALEADTAAAVIASTAPSPRAIPPEEIARVAESMGIKAIVEPDIGAAIDRAKRLAGTTDAVLVTGSLWFIGAARSHLVP
jgi:dihydrofolate synthase/folylpolyglutamate synthase